MPYQCFDFRLPQEHTEFLVAYCEDLPFLGFEYTATGVRGYLESGIDLSAIRRTLEEIRSILDFEYVVGRVADQNWNAQWEANFKPIRIEDFCLLRADFHDRVDGVRYDIIINPKMAFGTGHHATTFMMIRAMRQENFERKKVLDFGCGTGILAILARQMGATEVLAIDNDPRAVENTVDNIKLNEVEGVNAQLSTLEDVTDYKFDIILANINRSVLLRSFKYLADLLNPEGILIISGILQDDKALIEEAYTKYGFILVCIQNQNEWLCKTLKR